MIGTGYPGLSAARSPTESEHGHSAVGGNESLHPEPMRILAEGPRRASLTAAAVGRDVALGQAAHGLTSASCLAFIGIAQQLGQSRRES